MPTESLEGLVGRSAAMRTLISVIQRVAGSSSTVLLEGESGTGKEVTAVNIHRLSARSGPFVAINCGSMAARLLDSELFGHARGAFTGATQDREGLFRHADQGTLFLDEIGEMPLSLQSKLLRAIETLSIRPVGSEAEVAVDVRIVAATNRSMAELVEQGRFRADLYYRLNVLALRVPPLRERAEDIGDLVDFFSATLSARLGLSPLRLDATALRILQTHAWPGNVRELKNLVERAMLLGSSPDACLRVRPVDAVADQQSGASGYPLELNLAEVRKLHMTRTLAACGGNKSEASRRMGISRKTLERKLREWGAGIE
ncbi:sigma-54 interaction domain-containing protein [Rhodocyclaceae bacterium SMB388]